MKLAGVVINQFSLEDIFNVDSNIKHIVTVNAEALVFANEDNDLNQLIKGTYNCIDGQFPLFLFKQIYPNIAIKKLSGSDLIYDFCEFALLNNFKIMLLGGNNKSNINSVKYLNQKYANLKIFGFSPRFSDFPFPEDLNRTILDEIKKISPEVLFVGFGMKKQILWIESQKDTLNMLGVKWVIGSGGTFDFVAKNEKRAPKWIQKSGLEIFWRITQNPLRGFERLFNSLRLFNYI